MTKQRIAISLDPEAVARLDRLNARRFGGVYQGRSIVVSWALEIAERVLSDPATIGAADGSEVLEAYLDSRQAGLHLSVAPALVELLQRIDGVLNDLSTYPDSRIMDTAEAAREDIAETLTAVLLGRAEE